MILLTFFESLKIVLKKMVTLLMATLGLLKIKVFWKKGYDVIISAHDATNKILLRDSICIEDEVCDQDLVTLSLLWEKLSQPQFYKNLNRRNTFWGVVLVQVQ